MKKFIEVRTVDNVRVFIRKSQVHSVEEVPKSNRSEGFIKFYVGAYAFHVQMDIKEALTLLESETAEG